MLGRSRQLRNAKPTKRKSLQRTLQLEVFERRDMFAVDFMNAVDSLDVSADNNITAIDALYIINDINVGGPRQLPATRPSDAKYIDTSGDGFVTAIDALLVINQLNRGTMTGLSRVLRDASGFAMEETIRIGNGSAAGLRTFSLSLEAAFGSANQSVATADVFAVYLITNDRTHATLLDSGIDGSPIFTLSSSGATITPGVTRYEGNTLFIDLANVAQEAPIVKLQLLNHDTAFASKVTATPISNNVDPDGQIAERFERARQVAGVGGTTNVAAMTLRNDVDAELSEIQFDKVSGIYETDLSIFNRGAAIGRDTVVTFPGLPAGVVISNASGFTSAGIPYVNMQDAIRNGGLSTNDRSQIVRLSIRNPGDAPFALAPQISTGAINRQPTLSAISSITLMPGLHFVLALNANDPDGDTIRYSLTNAERMPTTSIMGNEIIFSPTASQIGTYQFDVVASDGVLSDQKSVTLSVIPDPVTTTRLSGRVLTVDAAPIVGMRVEVGAVQGITQADGSFLLDFGNTPVGDTLRIRADLFTGSNMPFIAEKIPLLLERDLAASINNQILRPIYLPTLNSGTRINPTVNQTVTEQLKPGEAPAAVHVAAGTLISQTGAPFTGDLSITEVPPSRTPAVLPSNVVVDTVVTIQPGDMTFAAPTPLTLPNRSNFPAGTELDLWSINPTTGAFDKVGRGKVSTDGSRIDTTQGGIRFSSWHFFAPPPTISPQDETTTPAACGAPTPCIHATSNVVVYSGTYLEDHTTPSYTSLGVDRSVTLVYSSKRSNPENVIRFNTDMPTWFDKSGNSDDHIGINIVVRHGETRYGIPGNGTTSSNTIVIKTGNVEGTDRVGTGVQFDMADMPDGVFQYTADIGAYRSNGSQSTASRVPLTGQLVKVSGKGSNVGTGWGIAGLQYLIVAPDESNVLLVDGNGTELLFTRNSNGTYTSPTGDFSVLSKPTSGNFQRRLKDGTAYAFNAANKLETVTDRNQNRTTYEYDSLIRLSRIVDPVGLATTFSYNALGLSAIILPDGRQTSFDLTAFGDLVKITDPDNSTRNFGYDGSHRIVSETTPLGAKETTEYDAFGRVRKVTRADGSTMEFSPAELKGVPYLARSFVMPKLPSLSNTGFTKVVMPSGNVITNKVDRDGQITSSRDSFGIRSRTEYDEFQQPTKITDSRGAAVAVSYDTRGNVQQLLETVTVSTNLFDQDVTTDSDGLAFPLRTQYLSRNISNSALIDVNRDSIPDLVMLIDRSVPNNSQQALSIALGNGKGDFLPEKDIKTWPGSSVIPISLNVVDMDGNGTPDISVGLVLNTSFGGLFENFSGNADSTFTPMGTVPLPNGKNPSNFQVSDLNGDGLQDILVNYSTPALLNVYIQSSEFTFDAPLEYALPADTSETVIRKVDTDNRPDVIAFNAATGNVSILKSNFPVSFEQTQQFTSQGAKSISVADFDKDGFLDVVLAGASVTFYKNDQDGKFSQDSLLSLAGSLRASPIDFDNDGDLDFVVEVLAVYTIGIYSITNNAGEFGTPRKLLDSNGALKTYVADINQDGRDEYIRMAAGIETLSFDNAGELPRPVKHAISSGDTVETTFPVVGDFNGDGIPDVAVNLRSGGSVSVVLGNGTGGVSDPISTTAISFVGVSSDFDDDGFDDLVSFGNRRLAIAYSNGDGPFSRIVELQTDLSPFTRNGISLADLNNDGVQDILIAGRSINEVGNITGSGVNLFLSQGTNGFVKAFSDVTDGGMVAHSTIANDFDKDGDVDFFVLGYTQQTIFDRGVLRGDLYLNSGTGSWTLSTRITFQNVDGSAASITTGDFNSDGKIDVAAGDANFSQLMIYLGNGDGTFSTLEPQSINQAWSPNSLVVADMNQDGKLDLMSSDGYPAPSCNCAPYFTYSIFLGDGQGKFLRRSFNASTRLFGAAVVDMDLNGRLDIVGAGENKLFLYGLQNTVEKNTLIQRFTYEPNYSSPTSMSDELNRVTQFAVDSANGNVTAITRPLGYRETMTYTASGLLDLHTDALGHVTDFDYDEFGRLVKVTSAKGTADEITQTLGYDAIGNVSQATDANGHTTRFEYDSKRRLTKETDALGGVTTYTRDAAGNVLSVTDALNRVTRFTYDAMSRLTSTTDPLGQKTTYSFDAAGNLVAVVDPFGKVTRSVYDVANRLVRSIDASGGTTKFTYDGNDNLLTVTDPVGNLTRYFYDERNRLVREQDPLLQSTFYLYDGANNLIAKRDRNDQQTSFVFDALNRQVEETWLGVNTGELANTITSTFDLNSNLLTIADDASKLTFSYDSLDRVKTASNLGTPGQLSVRLTYGYSGSNLVTTTDTISGVSGATVAYQLDELNRTKSILQTGTEIGTKRVDYTYNAISQYTGIMRSSNGDGSAPVVTTSFAYDDAYRLTMMDHRNATSTSLASFGFAYDAASRITQIVENGKAIDYSYDDRDQLTAANYADSIRTDETFVFDSNGNRTQSNAHGSAYRTGPANRLLTDGTFNYDYDKEGNLSKRTEIVTGNFREFRWDHRNRLVTVTDRNAAGVSQQVAKFTYDALDRRISKSVDTTPNDAVDAAIEQYVYDGEDVILDFVDADGGGPTPAAQTARYLRGPGIDNLLAIESNSQTLWVLQDQLGSTRAIVDQSGNIVQTIQYDAFGKALLDGQALTRYLFTGREVDSQTGLYYYRARYYDATIGKFVSEDPIGFRSNDVNLSRYVGNQPQAFTDPSGLFWDVVLDLGFIGYDLYRLLQDNVLHDCDNLGENLKALGLDVLGALLPFVTGLGAANRASELARLSKYEKDAIPQKAYDMIDHIKKHGKSPQGFEGGRPFKNRENLLPKDGKYREYDVDPRPTDGGKRNGERLIQDEKSGRSWYTDDHYSSFKEIHYDR